MRYRFAAQSTTFKSHEVTSYFLLTEPPMDGW